MPYHAPEPQNLNLRGVLQTIFVIKFMFRFDQVMTVTLRGELFTQDQYPFQLKAVFLQILSYSLKPQLFDKCTTDQEGNEVQ